MIIMTHEEMIEVIKGHAQGKAVQRSQFGKAWEDIDEPNWNFAVNEFRLKPEPKRKLPLGPEDFPPGTVLRRSSWPKLAWRGIEEVFEEGLLAHEIFLYVKLADGCWFRLLPNTTEWLPCYKEE